MTAAEVHPARAARGKERPSLQYYPGDLLKDPALNCCPDAAQLLWRKAIDHMHFCEPYGHLANYGTAMTTGQIAKLMGWGKVKTQRALDALAEAGVFSTTPDGVIYSRRMVRDEEVRNGAIAIGRMQGAHGYKGKEFGVLGGRPRKENPLRLVPTDTMTETPGGGFSEPPFSSSSSSSINTRAYLQELRKDLDPDTEAEFGNGYLEAMDEGPPPGWEDGREGDEFEAELAPKLPNTRAQEPPRRNPPPPPPPPPPLLRAPFKIRDEQPGDRERIASACDMLADCGVVEIDPSNDYLHQVLNKLGVSQEKLRVLAGTQRARGKGMNYVLKACKSQLEEEARMVADGQALLDVMNAQRPAPAPYVPPMPRESRKTTVPASLHELRAKLGRKPLSNEVPETDRVHEDRQD